ncbi:hypothetical protein [Pendulispora albinea]|uniref:Integral membrane protein n=1 Tax=Pendulispora albinea TaxID=2741071 RepID=A0ABZ2LQX4_9BACT
MSSTLLTSIDTVCAVSWTITYAAVIRRGFKDKSFGMPITALSANISWEASYAFFYEPFSDYLHKISIIWFFADVPIAVQCFLYGATDFDDPFIKRYFKLIFSSALLMAFPLLYVSFYEFHDSGGVYNGFGINFMMSVLFVAMLLRRGNVSGQSMYVAVFKWFGTLFAYLYLAVQATTDPAHPWPKATFVQDVIMHRTYPLTPMIHFLYLFTFVMDALYILLLYRKLKESNLDPWRRF